MHLWLAILLTALAGAVTADESVRICHGYGCLAQAHIRYSEGQLGLVRRIMARATDAPSERERLAETLGSVAGNLCVDTSKEMVVGLEINANHVRAMRSGVVTGTARALHVGRSTQLWEIRIENDDGKLVCVSRLTLAVVPRT